MRPHSSHEGHEGLDGARPQGRDRGLRRGLLALVGAAGLLAGATTAASAQPLGTPAPAPDAVVLGATDAVETYGNMATGSCLDDSQYGLRGYACNGGVYQKWNVHKWADNTRQFRNLATNECLYDDGVTLDTRACNSSRQQSWFVFVKGDKLTFQSQATGECLDDSQFGLRTIRCNGGVNQTWR
ncbi:RICIN domain-containing protein [Streptomyces sp. NPDC001941]|uniref:RICIN domain-containing protein n=1 Tax=Streptomyces sp. NPDC001941 TaxID=3154659 RepID=UPI00331FC38C